MCPSSRLRFSLLSSPPCWNVAAAFFPCSLPELNSPNFNPLLLSSPNTSELCHSVNWKIKIQWPFSTAVHRRFHPTWLSKHIHEHQRLWSLLRSWIPSIPKTDESGHWLDVSLQFCFSISVIRAPKGQLSAREILRSLALNNVSVVLRNNLLVLLMVRASELNRWSNPYWHDFLAECHEGPPVDSELIRSGRPRYSSRG